MAKKEVYEYETIKTVKGHKYRYLVHVEKTQTYLGPVEDKSPSEEPHKDSENKKGRFIKGQKKHEKGHFITSETT